MKHRDKLLWTFPRTVIIVLFLFCIISTTPAQTTLPAEDIAEKALAATVYLEMKDKNGKTLGIGSGFFVKPNLIATNYHVIEGAAKGTAKLVGKNVIFVIEGVSGTDAKNDLALLKITMPGIKPAQDAIGLVVNEIILERRYGIKPVLLGDSDDVRIGETVYVAGNPKGLEGTFSDGIISSRRDKHTKERLQMTAPISPGSSGGPVLNRKGEVIGVSFAGHRALDAQNLNFAIPSKYLKKLLEQSKSAKPLSQGIQSISAETYFRWGKAKFDLGDYAGAIKDYTMAIRLKSDYVNAYYNRGNVKADLEQYTAAISDYDIAIRLKPDLAEAYVNRGTVKDSLGQHFAAISDYDVAIRLKPDDAVAYLNRGVAKGSLGQHFAAISDYDTAIRLKPDDVKAYYNRGNVKADLEQYTAAISDYDIAIRLKPDLAEAYVNRGTVKDSLGQHFAAISDYDTAIRLKPDDAVAYLNRGVAKGSLGQHFAAISDYDTAIRLKPDDVKAYYNRGIAKDLLGQTLEAKQDLRTALRLAIKAGDTGLKVSAEKALRILNE